MNRLKAVEMTLANIDGEFVRALAEPVRLEILKLLIVQGACDVKTLAEQLPQDRSVISRHLALMEKAGLLLVKKEGRHKIYQVDGTGSLAKAEQLVESIRTCLSLGCC